MRSQGRASLPSQCRDVRSSVSAHFKVDETSIGYPHPYIHPRSGTNPSAGAT